MKNIISAVWFVCFALLMICSVYAKPVAAEEQIVVNEAIRTYQNHRELFVAKQKEKSQEYHASVTSLNNEIKEIQTRIVEKKAELNQLNESIAGTNFLSSMFLMCQNAASTILFPEFGVVSILGSWAVDVSGVILYIFLCITIINLFVYLSRSHKGIFEKYKIALIAVLVILIASISSPLFAEELSKQEKIIGQLELVEKVLSRSDHERFIAILEAKQAEIIQLPHLESGHPMLLAYREVKIETPEYWFTLAALYFHEGMTGKAVEAIKQLTMMSNFQDTDSHHHILVNSISFLIENNETELVNKSMDKLEEPILSASVLLDIASLLQKNNMRVSSEKVFGYAVNKADTVSELVDLSYFLFKAEENGKGTEALRKALVKAKEVDEFLLVASAAVAASKDPILEHLNQKVLSTLFELHDRIKIVDLYLNHGRQEEAVMLFSEMIRVVTSTTKDNIAKLLFLIDAGLERAFLAQTANAAEKLYLFLGKDRAFSTQIHTGTSLQTAQGLPDNNKIMLPQFYGLINEERGFNDQAETAYILAVTENLKRILDSYGYEMPLSMNDYYLLGRIWVKADRDDLIGKLDRVYTIIEDQFLKQQVIRNKGKYEELKQQIEQLKDEHLQLVDEVAQKEIEEFQANKAMVLRGISMTATITLVLAALIGCLILSYVYMRNLSSCKSYGFFTKFLETTGWLRIMSILGALSGIVAVLFSQLLQLLQRNQENTYKAMLANIDPPVVIQGVQNGDTRVRKIDLGPNFDKN